MPVRNRSWRRGLLEALVFSCMFAAGGFAQTPSPPPNPFAAPQARVQYAPDREFDLLRVSLDLNVDYAKLSFQGRVVNTLAPLRDGLASITLHAGANLKIEKCEIDGRKAEFTRQGNLLKIVAPQPLGRGKSAAVAVQYTGGDTNPGWHWIRATAANPELGGFWTGGQPVRNHGWVPTWDYPNDFALTETRVTVPEGWYVVGNGALKSTTWNRTAKTRTFHWQMDQPHATYLLSLAAGPVDVKTEEWRGVRLMYVVPKGKANLIENTFGDTPDLLSFYSDLLGLKYPWAKYAQLAMYDFRGGLENVSATIFGDGILVDPRRGFRAASPLVAHELSHQWFGDLVTYKHWGEVWLGEGFATFFGQLLYAEHWRGKDAYDIQLESFSQNYFGESRRYKRPLSTNFYDNPDAMFDVHTYAKGALILHTLRRYLGDKLFYQGLQHYLVKHRNTPVDSYDLCNAMTEATGINLVPFFDQWIFKSGHPVLDYGWTWDSENKQVAVTVKQTQDTKDGTPVYDLNATIGLISSGQLRREKVRIDRAEHEFRIEAMTRPDAVLLDPDHDFLREIPNLNWNAGELPHILKYASNATDRQEAMNRMLRGTPSDDAVQAIVAAIRRDSGPFPAFSSIDRLGELKRAELRPFFREELAHPDINRRAQAIRALARLPRDGSDTEKMRALINDREAYAVLGASVQTLADWDAAGNREIFRKALAIAGEDISIRLAAHIALLRADTAEGKQPVDPNPQIMGLARNFLSDVASGNTNSTFVTEGLRPVLSDGNVARQVAGWLRDLKSFTFIASEDVQREGIVRRGAPVRSIWYYRMVTGPVTISITLFMTADGKIADVAPSREQP
jgi:aminopeptidase N